MWKRTGNLLLLVSLCVWGMGTPVFAQDSSPNDLEKGKVEKKEKKEKKEKNTAKPLTRKFQNHRRCGPDMTFFLGKDPEYQKLWKEDLRLAGEAERLLQTYRSAPVEEQAKLKADLKTLMKQHFQVRQQRRAYELKKMEERIQKFRSELEQRDKNADKIIEDRLERMLENDESNKF